MSNINRNSVEKSDQQVMKHICKLCNKGFPCGRSLGGHMRSHVINSTDQYHHHQNNNKNNKNKKKMKLLSVNDVGNSMNSSDLGYELRKDPKKTIKAVVNDSNSDEFAVLDKLCKECGKGFMSWKALFGHMKCHSENSGANKNMNIPRIKKSKPRARNVVTKDSSSDSLNGNQVSTSVVSDIVDDQEAEVAMCLIMLSRDVGSWGEKVIESGCKMKDLEAHESGFDDQGKRSFECVTCNKSFYSYQALGGHKASHKKLKTDDTDMIKGEPVLDHDQVSSSFNLGESLKSTMVVGAHECSICFRVFSSGQALGGHKRSHLIAEAKLNQQKPNLVTKFDEPVKEIRGSFDLNMLPDEEEQEIVVVNTSSTGYNPWCYNHESAVLGLLSTS